MEATPRVKAYGLFRAKRAGALQLQEKGRNRPHVQYKQSISDSYPQPRTAPESVCTALPQR
ncbi:hypothetical protein GCM10017710_45530 [Arthrobacter ramosus]